MENPGLRRPQGVKKATSAPSPPDHHPVRRLPPRVLPDATPVGQAVQSDANGSSSSFDADQTAMPWNVPCPHIFPAEHQIADAHRELLEPADYTSTEQGKTALTCPTCGKPFVFPNGWFGGVVDGTGYPIVYWSKARWDRAPDLWKADARRTTPNLEQFLR